MFLNFGGVTKNINTIGKQTSVLMAADIFTELGIIIFVAFMMASVLRILKQPLIISYIFSGILLGPSALNIISSPDNLKVFSELGVAILLFMVGISINPKIIRDVGKASLVTGLGQIIFTSLIGYVIAYLLGFSVVASIYIAIALTFSSTIIIMKLLSDKGDLETLYGRISVGFLIVQDIVAILIMLVVSSFASSGAGMFSAIILTILKAAGLIALLLIASDKLLPKITAFMAKSQELLFMFSIAWCLAIAVLFYYFNFSIEIGALIAGVTLSLSPYRYEINSKMKSLRDFFISLFFIYLGSQLIISDVSRVIVPIIIFSIFILIGNPLVVIILMGQLGYEKKIGFLSGLTVAQISEFSIILIALGIKMNHLTADILSLVTVVGLITIAGSTYFIMYSEKIYPGLAKFLAIFEKKKKAHEPEKDIKGYEIVLFGYHRIGYDLIEKIENMKKSFIIVDYDPAVIAGLEEKGLSCMYGDAGNAEFLEEVPIARAKLIITTIPDTETNLLIIKKAAEMNRDAIIITVSHHVEDSLAMYEAGATYVIMPYFLGAHYTSGIISEYGTDLEKYLEEKIKHLGYLAKMKDKAHIKKQNPYAGQPIQDNQKL